VSAHPAQPTLFDPDTPNVEPTVEPVLTAEPIVAEPTTGEPPSQTSDPGRVVPTRRISFDETLANLPKHFAGDGDLIMSHLAAGLSSTFPEGEEFFIRSVRRYRDQITDPKLKRQVAGFIGQEAVHGREHRVMNARLDALGYPASANEKRVKRGLGLQERLTSAEACLAHTAAVEHITATLAELILTNADVRASFGPEVGPVFTWHALEESEHKAVAFDVYRAVGGSERERVRMMRLTRWAFVVSTTLQVGASLLGDRTTYQRGRLRTSWRRFKASPIMQRELWDQLKDYERPDFHPDDSDTTELVATWRAELFGDTGTLQHLLAG